MEDRGADARIGFLIAGSAAPWWLYAEHVGYYGLWFAAGLTCVTGFDYLLVGLRHSTSAPARSSRQGRTGQRCRWRAPADREGALRILYLAWLRGKIGTAREDVSPPSDVTTVGALMDWLAASRPGFAEALAAPGVIRAAVNQDYAQPGNRYDPTTRSRSFRR